jgi:hypothetical protein
VKGVTQVSDERDLDGEAIIRDSVLDILANLLARLRLVGITPESLGEPAQAAIRAAVESAVVEGYNLGVRKIAFQVVDQGYTIDLVLQPLSIEDVWEDVWAERYDEQETNE